MSDDQHYYIAGYSVEDDPYSQPNGVLINIHGITETSKLNIIEAESSAIALQELSLQPPPKEFSVATLQAYHKELFQDVYPWAGEFRKVDIAKGDSYFESHQKISDKLEALFADCKSKNFLTGLSQEDFAKESAAFLGELNRIHPFREGNGRTQRLLVGKMALNAGYEIKWEGISESAMKKACVDSHEGNPESLRKLVKLYLEPSSLQQAKAVVKGNITGIRESNFGNTPDGDVPKP